MDQALIWRLNRERNRASQQTEAKLAVNEIFLLSSFYSDKPLTKVVKSCENPFSKGLSATFGNQNVIGKPNSKLERTNISV